MTRRIVVTGRVQGVGFRAFVAARARTLGVKGCVWNRRDGAVEIIASSDASQLAVFEQFLHTGPGHVSGVSAVDSEELFGAEGFRVDVDRNA